MASTDVADDLKVWGQGGPSLEKTSFPTFDAPPACPRCEGGGGVCFCWERGALSLDGQGDRGSWEASLETAPLLPPHGCCSTSGGLVYDRRPAWLVFNDWLN